VKKEKINEIERTRVRSPPRATSLKNTEWHSYVHICVPMYAFYYFRLM
jgi:hypothetical protein